MTARLRATFSAWLVRVVTQLASSVQDWGDTEARRAGR